MPLIQLEKLGIRFFLGENRKKIYFGHVIFEMPIRHPSGNLKYPVTYTSQNLRREVV